jgi:hypothetical protein
MRQEVGDDEGEIVEWEARGTAQGADDRPFLVTGLPEQLVRPAGAVPAISHTTLAPFADGLGADAIAPGQCACGLSRAGDLSGTHGQAWYKRWGGWRASGRSSRLGRPLEPIKAPSVRLNGPAHLIPVTFRYLIPSCDRPSADHEQKYAAPRRSYLAQHRPMTEVSVPLRRTRPMRAIYC